MLRKSLIPKTRKKSIGFHFAIPHEAPLSHFEIYFSGSHDLTEEKVKTGGSEFTKF